MLHCPHPAPAAYIGVTLSTKPSRRSLSQADTEPSLAGGVTSESRTGVSKREGWLAFPGHNQGSRSAGGQARRPRSGLRRACRRQWATGSRKGRLAGAGRGPKLLSPERQSSWDRAAPPWCLHRPKPGPLAVVFTRRWHGPRGQGQRPQCAQRTGRVHGQDGGCPATSPWRPAHPMPQPHGLLCSACGHGGAVFGVAVPQAHPGPWAPWHGPHSLCVGFGHGRQQGRVMCPMPHRVHLL